MIDGATIFWVCVALILVWIFRGLIALAVIAAGTVAVGVGSAILLGIVLACAWLWDTWDTYRRRRKWRSAVAQRQGKPRENVEAK